MPKLTDIVDNFKGKKIGVIGDLMLDQFIFGHAERMSPEAPVPVVLFSKEIFTLGGAANVANNVASLGGIATLVGVVGKDAAGGDFLRELASCGLDDKGIIALESRKTTQKARVVAQGQHIVRIDREQADLINKEIEKQAIVMIESQMKTWDLVVISDYNKGFVTKNVVAAVIKSAKKHKKKVIADVKPANLEYFKHIFLLVPNQKEALEMGGTENVESAGKIIQKKIHSSVLLKRGADGMTLFEGGVCANFAAKAKEVFDVSGAGDTVLAAVSLALCSGAGLKQAAEIANHAAGISVAKVGTATVLPEELKKDLLGNE